ncbi:hypothetical protein GCM10010967_33450 [Dyadobacter beijingensis]|uniref:Uncharacterized protein n=1 Tax=Dyadobacter beijingensis TaxID=365489 RepID=A0ABQ2I0H5_9BACT|nr:DUF2613 domain-containing protein [Dyadobacter beijingensis]GGM96956.1 hypothetical protein GCM10010967_33450 [Dyadobacter beijingensis]
MNISQALIEKYHQGLCTAEEKAAVEQWLDDADEPGLDFPAALSKEEIKMEIWDGLRAEVTHSKSPKVWWKYAGMVAAAVVILVSGVMYVQKSTPEVSVAAGNAPSSEALQIEYGTESGAEYSQETQMLNFCGVIKITPRKNMKLSFTSICDGKRETVREMDVKGGTTYFAMDVKDQNSSQLIVMDKSLVDELPPILQNSLIAQFGI